MQVIGTLEFRVEEYKKPEFEVIVEAPDEPVALGEMVTATVKANYYFGAPVANGTVKYTVKRSKHDARWYPVRPGTGSTAAATGGMPTTTNGTRVGGAGAASRRSGRGTTGTPIPRKSSSRGRRR